MKFAVRQLAAAAALSMAGLASAGTVTAHPGETIQGLTLIGGTAVLSFSEDLIAALNVGQVAVSAVTPASVSESFDMVDGVRVRVASVATAGLTYMTVNDITGDVLSAGSAGGATMTAPKLSQISRGGSLTVANLSVDLEAKRVYADITGNFTTVTGAAPTTITHFHLWDFTNLTGPTNVQVGEGTFTNVISGLKITPEGLTNFTNALSLLTTGRSALAGVTDFGTITSTIVASGTLVQTTPTIPEPGTWAMMGLGFAGVGLMARRRRAA